MIMVVTHDTLRYFILFAFWLIMKNLGKAESWNYSMMSLSSNLCSLSLFLTVFIVEEAKLFFCFPHSRFCRTSPHSAIDTSPALCLSCELELTIEPCFCEFCVWCVILQMLPCTSIRSIRPLSGLSHWEENDFILCSVCFSPVGTREWFGSRV